MSQDTLQALLKGGFYLYGFKAIQSSDQNGRPLVCFGTQNYAINTALQWSTVYQAYTSSSQIIPNTQISIGFSQDIQPGQTLNVEEGGIGDVVNGGPTTAISIYNTTTTQFTCGILEEIGGVDSPVCTFPLYGKHVETITPLEKVLVMFSTKYVQTGTVIEYFYDSASLNFHDGEPSNSTSSSLLIDFTSDNQREVNYDINQGWEWGGYSWAQQIAANANIVPLLIET